jgi:hypothetical protein
VNEKFYIHEYININGSNRGKYMYHMTANFSPMAQEDRNQLCYGVWGVLGSTGRWPEVLNMWELDSFDAAADYFRIEVGGAALQDPRMAKWWRHAVPLRAGGVDRLLVPAPWTKTIGEICAAGIGGELYAHDEVKVRPGTAPEYLDLVRDHAVGPYARRGWTLAGAWYAVMTDETECYLLWAIDTWENWTDLEKAQRSDPELAKWNGIARTLQTSLDRIVLVDAPLSPFKTHRQVLRSDRTEPWDEEVSESELEEFGTHG